MSIELKYLTLTILVTSLFWVPYVLDRMRARGLQGALGNNPISAEPTSVWAGRMVQAHKNAIENLMLFAPLVLIVQLGGFNSAITAMAVIIYFYSRVAHFVIYSFEIPYLRTITFALGFATQITLVMVILGLI